MDRLNSKYDVVNNKYSDWQAKRSYDLGSQLFCFQFIYLLSFYLIFTIFYDLVLKL